MTTGNPSAARDGSGPRGRWRLAACALAGTALCAALGSWRWGGLRGWVRALDHCPILFCDFERHYLPTARAILEGGDPVVGYLYSPLFALLLAPWTALPPAWATAAWGALQLVAALTFAAVGAAALRRRANWCAALFVALLACSHPLYHNLKWGQVSVAISAACVGVFLLHARRQTLAAALLLALATAVKGQAGLFAVFFVVARDWRFLAIYAAGVAGFAVGVPLLALGAEGVLRFYEIVGARAVELLDGVHLRPNTQYYAHVLERLSGGRFLDVPVLGRYPELLGAAVLAGHVALLEALRRRGEASLHGFALALLFTATPWVAATSWPHYLVYLAWVQAWCAAAIPGPVGFTGSTGFRGLLGLGRPASAVAASLLAFSAVASSLPFFAIFADWPPYGRQGWLFFSNLAAQAVVVGLALRALRSPPVEAPADPPPDRYT